MNGRDDDDRSDTCGPIVEVPLTMEQRRELERDTGLDRATVKSSPQGYIAMALAAESMLAGSPPARINAPFILELTHSQQERLRQELGTSMSALLIDPDTGEVRFSEDWADDFRPFSLGRLRVVNHQTSRDRIGDPDVIRLLPAHEKLGAFGTGRHASTRLAAQLLEAWLEPGTTVADIGTGSGILAIAAMRLGASRLLALEIDESSAEWARRNIQVNELTDRVVVAHREIDNDRDGVFDLVLANLFPSILIDKAPVLGKAVQRSGVLVISGVVCRRIDQVGAIVESVGFQTLEQRSMGGWAARAMRRQT